MTDQPMTHDPSRPLNAEEYVEGCNQISYLAQFARAFPAEALAQCPLAKDTLQDAIKAYHWLQEFWNTVDGEFDRRELEVEEYVEACRREPGR